MEGEHDLEDAHDRYEKRWMIKENERKAKVETVFSFLCFLSSYRRDYEVIKDIKISVTEDNANVSKVECYGKYRR